MTRENRQICPVPGCGKRVQRLGAHFINSHPGMNANDFGAGLAPLKPPGAQQVVPAAAPEPQQVDPGIAQSINKLLEHIEGQAAVIQAQQERIEALAKEQSTFQESVLKNFNDMPKMVDRSVTGHFDQILAEAQARQAGASGNGQQETAMVAADGAPIVQQPGGIRGGGMMDQVLPMFLQWISGQNKPAGGDMMSQLAMMKQIADVFNPMPNMLAGMNMATMMFTAAARAGLRPEDAAKGNQDLIQNLTPKTPGKTG
jgi:hypothetical protein